MIDTETKLALVANQMHLEPAEETSHLPAAQVSGIPSPQRRVPASSTLAPCGFSPDELRNVVVTGAIEPITRKNGGPGRELDAKKNSLGLYDAAMPGGKRITLLKTLLTSACERDCFYCPFRARRNYRRATFKPEEMALVFHQMFDAQVAEGLFLSSGVAGGGVRTQDRLIATAEILRRKYNYTGYLHLKIMPGAERDQVWRAMQLADRISINLEAPNAERLVALAPHKVFGDELLRPLQWAEEIRKSQPAHLGWNGRWPSTVTQFVVGAAGESDLEILSTTAYLLQQLKLTRTYFSAFSPIADTPLENQSAENPWREHRLYLPVWTLDSTGLRIEAVIAKTIRRPVLPGSSIVHLALSDGRAVKVSAAHPTTDGRTIGDLSIGDRLDGARVVRAENIPYNEPAKYDLLPAGETGSYWANGIPMNSTIEVTERRPIAVLA